MTQNLTIDNLISLIRNYQGVPDKEPISESTLIENELGITGDDGDDLLEEIEKQFNLSFKGNDGSLREFFNLEEDQYLFHSEGVDLFGLFAFLFGKNRENVKPITVGELYSGALKAKNRKING